MGINTGILHNAEPLSTERIKELEKQVLENQESFAYLDENSELCFALPFEPDLIKDLAWNNAYELSAEENNFTKKAYKKTGLKTFSLDKVLSKSNINDSWGEPERLEGDGQEFYTMAPSTLSFRSTAPLNELQDVQINGQTVDPSNYDLEEGSTIVKLKYDYLSTLDKGKYEVAIISDSKTVKGDFTIAAPELNEYGFYYNVPYSYSVTFDSLSFSGIEGAVVFLDNGTVMNVELFGDITYSQLTKDGGSYSFLMSFTDGSVTATGNFSADGKTFVGVDAYVDPEGMLQPSFSAPGFDCTINTEFMAADTDYLYITDYEYSSYSIQPNTQKASYSVSKTAINDKPVSSIAYKAFYNRADLTSLEISDSITTINWCAFEGCTGLSTIIFNGTISQWMLIYKGGCGEGEPWNRDIPATHVHCIDGDVAL